jgi:beta-lactamase superfamily II metal-dependent hydrolase
MIPHCRCPTLKVGHHGSAYSSNAAFIGAVHPRIAIVSVGRHNLFGHPAPSTLETLHHAGASIFRTDECGAVTVTAGVAATPTISSMLPYPSAPHLSELGEPVHRSSGRTNAEQLRLR